MRRRVDKRGYYTTSPVNEKKREIQRSFRLIGMGSMGIGMACPLNHVHVKITTKIMTRFYLQKGTPEEQNDREIDGPFLGASAISYKQG